MQILPARVMASLAALLTSCMCWVPLASAQPAKEPAEGVVETDSATGADSAAGDASPAESSDASPPPTKETIERAGRHFERGLQLYNDAEYRLALIEFERAYQLVPNYRVKYNIAQVSIQIGRYAHAVRALNDYLKEGGEKISEERHEQVQADLKMLAARTARVLVSSNVDGAEILLGDKVLARTPLESKLLIDAGEHRLSLRHPGYQAHSEQVTLAGGDDLSLTIDLKPVKKSQQVVLVREVEKARNAPVAFDTGPKEDGFPYATVGWVATGGLTVGAVVTGIVALVTKDERDSLVRPDPDQDPEDADELRGEIDAANTKLRNWSLASDILKGAALAAGVTSLYFTLGGSDSKNPVKNQAVKQGVQLRAGAGLNQVWVEGRF